VREPGALSFGKIQRDPTSASYASVCPTRLDQGDQCEGLRCFRSGAFFEAHEHWEGVWLDPALIQGLLGIVEDCVGASWVADAGGTGAVEFAETVMPK
jgi:hypothetical protein